MVATAVVASGRGCGWGSGCRVVVDTRGGGPRRRARLGPGASSSSMRWCWGGDNSRRGLWARPGLVVLVVVAIVDTMDGNLVIGRGWGREGHRCRCVGAGVVIAAAVVSGRCWGWVSSS